MGTQYHKAKMKTSSSRSEYITALLIEYTEVHENLSYNSDQETLLHAACRSGYSAMTAALLKSGADVQAVDKDGNTAFHLSKLRFIIYNLTACNL